MNFGGWGFTHPQKVGLWHWIYRTKSQALWQSSVCPGQNRSMRARLEHRPRGIEVGRWSSSASGAIVMGSAKIRTISIEKMMNHIFAIYLPYFVYSMRKAVVKGLQRWLPAAKRCLVYAKLRWGMFFRILIFFEDYMSLTNYYKQWIKLASNTSGFVWKKSTPKYIGCFNVLNVLYWNGHVGYLGG